MFRPANFIETAVRNVQRDLAVGAVLVVLVLFLFLYNARTAFICATAIPTSLFGAVLVLDYFGIGLNIMVLGGLAIALGEVVDDAIIDTENIFRRLRLNRLLPLPRPADEVVLDASLEVRSSVVYATFIVALVFVPLLTLSGVAGKLFAPLGFAYILAILASLIVALSLTPALCYLLLGAHRAQERGSTRGGLAQATLRRDPAAYRTLPGQSRKRRVRPDCDRHRHPAAILGRVHPRATRGALHHPYDGGARYGRVGVAADRKPGGEGHRFYRGREIGGAVGRTRAQRRRYLRHALQRVRGGNRSAQRQGAGAHPPPDPRDAIRASGRGFRRRRLCREHFPHRADRGDDRRVRGAAGRQPVRHKPGSAGPRRASRRSRAVTRSRCARCAGAGPARHAADRSAVAPGSRRGAGDRAFGRAGGD